MAVVAGIHQFALFQVIALRPRLFEDGSDSECLSGGRASVSLPLLHKGGVARHHAR
jgi:hypothetical protein